MTPRDWVLILGQWCAVGVFAVAALYGRSKRIQAVGEAGPLVLRVARPRVRAWHLVILFVLCITLVPQWVSVLINGVPPRELAHMALYTIIPFIVYPTMRADAYVEARENGIVCNQAFWPWGCVENYEWLDDGRTLRLRRARYDFTDFRIAESQKNALDRILRQNTRGSDEVEQNLPPREAKVG